LFEEKHGDWRKKTFSSLENLRNKNITIEKKNQTLNAWTRETKIWLKKCIAFLQGWKNSRKIRKGSKTSKILIKKKIKIEKYKENRAKNYTIQIEEKYTPYIQKIKKQIKNHRSEQTSTMSSAVNKNYKKLRENNK